MSPALRAAALTLLLVTTHAHCLAAGDPAIEHLLSYVAESPCVFVRNSTRHNGAEAAEHLRMKYERGEAYVKNADAFIDRIASRSSWTGEPYTVECPGAAARDSAGWLRDALRHFRDSAASR